MELVVFATSLKFFFVEGGEQFIVGIQTAKKIGLKARVRITIAGISSLDFARSASVSRSPIVKLKCRFCFFLIARSISLSGVEAGETVAVAAGALAVGDCVGACANEPAASAIQQMQTINDVFIVILWK